MASSRGYLFFASVLQQLDSLQLSHRSAAALPVKPLLGKTCVQRFGNTSRALHNHQRVVNMDPALGAFAPPWNDDPYSPIVRMTLLSGRVLFDDSLSSCESISSYFGTVVTSPFGTMCTTL